MDYTNIIDLFIRNFVVRGKRERAGYELKNSMKRGKFCDRLNHKWHTVIDMRCILKIPDNQNDYDFTKEQLKIGDTERCYLISNYDDIDGKIMGFEEAFDKSYGRGLATLIVNVDADKLYLETELVQGKQNRFIGKR